MLVFYENHKVYMNGKYPAIWLNGENVHLHRYVWEKHFGKIPDGFIVHHKDENKMNWSIGNLELVSRSEHIRKHQHNLHNENTRRFGEKARRHKLTQKQVDEIRKVYKKYDKHSGGRALAKKYDVSEHCISSIVRGISWG